MKITLRDTNNMNRRDISINNVFYVTENSGYVFFERKHKEYSLPKQYKLIESVDY
jgi:hypothetical protein